MGPTVCPTTTTTTTTIIYPAHRYCIRVTQCISYHIIIYPAHRYCICTKQCISYHIIFIFATSYLSSPTAIASVLHNAFDILLSELLAFRAEHCCLSSYCVCIVGPSQRVQSRCVVRWSWRKRSAVLTLTSVVITSGRAPLIYIVAIYSVLARSTVPFVRVHHKIFPLMTIDFVEAEIEHPQDRALNCCQLLTVKFGGHRWPNERQKHNKKIV